MDMSIECNLQELIASVIGGPYNKKRAAYLLKQSGGMVCDLNHDCDRLTKGQRERLRKALLLCEAYTQQSFPQSFARSLREIGAAFEGLRFQSTESLRLLMLSDSLSVVSNSHEHDLFKGGVRSVVNCTTTIMRAVLKCSRATKFIMAHNHPTGDFNPSKEDVYFFRKVSAASRNVGLTLLDSIIVTSNGFYSIDNKVYTKYDNKKRRQ